MAVVDLNPECVSYVYDPPLRQSLVRSKGMFDAYNRVLSETMREKLFRACFLSTYGGYSVVDVIAQPLSRGFPNTVWCGVPNSPLLWDFLQAAKKHVLSPLQSAFPTFVSDISGVRQMDECQIQTDISMYVTQSIANKRFAIFVLPSPCVIQIRFANYSNLLHISCEKVPAQVRLRIVNMVTNCESVRTITLTNTDSYRLL